MQRSLLSLRLAALITLLAAGCDLSGQYERRFQEALTSSASRANYDLQLFPAETAVNAPGNQATGVKLRVPKLFDPDPKISQALPASNPRSQPPFLALPSWSYTAERQLDDGNNQYLPTYMYFAAVPKAAAKGEKAVAADALQKSIVQQLAAAFPGAAWADAQLTTPEGKTLTLKRLRVEGKQDFVNIQTGKNQTTDGRFDLYFIETPGHHVLIGWRSPKVQGEKYFYAASDLAMGTLAAPGVAGKSGGG